MLLIAVVVLFGLVTTSSTMPEHVCGDIDITGDLCDFEQFNECTVVEGNVYISYIYDTVSEQFENVSFPQLREITGFLIVHVVDGLTSLSNLFPNLALIRGQELFHNYALIINSMKALETIGLGQLVTISKGGVRVDSNPNLCYASTVSWKSIVDEAYARDIHIMDNKPSRQCADACPKVQSTDDFYHERCPVVVERSQKPNVGVARCWSSKTCQKVCPKSCPNSCYENTAANGIYRAECCHLECLAGCTGPTASDCVSCANYYYNGTCVSECPKHPVKTYKLRDRRCVTESECRRKRRNNGDKRGTVSGNWKLLPEGTCAPKCPNGYEETDHDPHVCENCTGPCVIECPGMILVSRSDGQLLRNCTKIVGDLQILLVRDSEIVEEELTRDLSTVEEITGSLHILYSHDLTSLQFLRNLRVIGSGIDRTTPRKGQLAEALLVQGNQGLQELWDLRDNPLTVMNGDVHFIGNLMLCNSVIKNFMSNLNLVNATAPYKDDLNGHYALCAVEKFKLNVSDENIGDVKVTVEWNNNIPAAVDDDGLISWRIHYRNVSEDENETTVMHNLPGECKSISNRWKVLTVKPVEDVPTNVVTIENLKPFQRYVVYVDANKVRTHRTGVKSDLVFFTTRMSEPDAVRDVVVSGNSTALTVTWQPSPNQNGILDYYEIRWEQLPLKVDDYELRDYCKEDTRSHSAESAGALDTLTISATIAPPAVGCCKCDDTPKTNDDEDNYNRKWRFHLDFLNHMLIKYTDRPPVENVTRCAAASPVVAYTKAMLAGNSRPESAVNVTTVSTVTMRPGLSKDNAAITVRTVRVNKDDTQYTVTHLKPFRGYSIEVRGCNVNDSCGDWASKYESTEPDDAGDVIDTASISDELFEESRAHIQWKEPLSPNGVIVMYQVELSRTDGDEPNVEVLCVSLKTFREYGGYKTRALLPGNWSYRVRARSPENYGQWTSFRHFIIRRNLVDSGAETRVVAVTITVAVAIVLVTFFVLLKIYLIRRRKLEMYRDICISVNENYREGWFDPLWELPRETVIYDKEIGQGSFGMVYSGTIPDRMNASRRIEVAVKTVNNAERRGDNINFMFEACAMKQLDCQHIVRLFGIVSKGFPILVVMELMKLGDLKNFLRAKRRDDGNGRFSSVLTSADFIKMAAEIADGMAYMADRKLLHRDLAARNCMLSENLVVKIGDFGMSRDVYSTNYYRKRSRGLLPIRWMSPEALQDGVFTVQSDVWSYGVVLWEMATLAIQPYPGLSDENVIPFVTSGGTMQPVEGFSPKLSRIMMQCWKKNPSDRPSFGDVIEELLDDLPGKFREVSYYLSAVDCESIHPSSESSNSRVSTDASEVHIPTTIDFELEATLPLPVCVDRGQPDGAGVVPRANSSSSVSFNDKRPSLCSQYYDNNGTISTTSDSAVAFLQTKVASDCTKKQSRMKTFQRLLGFA